MPRPLGLLLIATASLLCGVLAWFCLVWLISAGAGLARAPVLDGAMLILSPHVAGWPIALLLAVLAFVLGVRFARAHRLAWLGFAADSAINAGRDRQPASPHGRSGLTSQAVSMDAGTSIEATFCFVDIAGYTALTETHGEHAAADLVDQFGELVRASIGPSGQLQEIIGDCAFIVFPNPLAAIGALAALYRSIADRQEFPIVRAGLHHGGALLRGDRHFGSTVNLAARVAARATGGQILCTQYVVDALVRSGVADIEIEHQGLVSLRNLPQPVDVYEIVLSSCSREYAIDPVCKMQVDTRRAAGELHFNHKTYWFCSLTCVERFAAQPSSYVQPA